MREEKLGDSYDMLKRFWVELLSTVAPMHAHGHFILNVPEGFRQQYVELTKAQITDNPEMIKTSYSLLLDPDTGIPLPNAQDQRLRSSHAPISFIVRRFDHPQLAFVVCYDQSMDRHARHAGDTLVHQLDVKRRALLDARRKPIHSFYYVSHARFLFASRSVKKLKEIRDLMLMVGIPSETTAGVRLQEIM